MLLVNLVPRIVFYLVRLAVLLATLILPACQDLVKWDTIMILQQETVKSAIKNVNHVKRIKIHV